MGTCIWTIFILAREGTLGPPPLFSRITRRDDSPEPQLQNDTSMVKPSPDPLHRVMVEPPWPRLRSKSKSWPIDRLHLLVDAQPGGGHSQEPAAPPRAPRTASRRQA
jgi:hypothetical protein